MCKCENVQMWGKCANVRMCRCANDLMSKDEAKTIIGKCVNV